MVYLLVMLDGNLVPDELRLLRVRWSIDLVLASVRVISLHGVCFSDWLRVLQVDALGLNRWMLVGLPAWMGP